MTRRELLLPEFDRLAAVSWLLPELRRHTQTALFDGRRILDAELRSIKGRSYDPPKQAKSSVLATYELMVEPVDGSTSPAQEHLFLRCFLDGRSARFSDNRSGIVSVPSLDGYAWVFPHDPLIPGLAAVAEPDAARERIPSGHRHSAEPLTVECLRYKPENRCTLRITAADDYTSGLIAKVFADTNRAESLARVGQMLHDRSTESGGAFIVPRPLAFDRNLSILWLEELAGTAPVRETLDSSSVGRVATALAAFHQISLPGRSGLAERTVDHQLAETTRHITGLSELFPDRAGALGELRTRLAEEAADFERAPTGVIHGAFRLRQLLLDDDRVGMLDFDGLAVGDPVEDLADFVLDLEPSPTATSDSDSNGHRRARSQEHRLADIFLTEYARRTGRVVDPRRLNWYLRAKLLKRAYWLRHAAHCRPPVAVVMGERVDQACHEAPRTWLEAVR